MTHLTLKMLMQMGLMINSDDWILASGVMTPGRGYAAFAQDNGLAFHKVKYIILMENSQWCYYNLCYN